MVEPVPVPPLLVELKREPFSDLIELKYEGQSEELDAEQVREWFQVRGANMAVVDRALDYIYNFYETEVLIENPAQVKSRVGLVDL